MMKKKVMFLCFTMDNGYSLLAPYLAEYASLDPEIGAYWDFESHKNSVCISPEELESDMLEKNADVYAFSCYVWNMGLIKKAVFSCLEKKPDTKIILGGPQVSWQGEKYLSGKYEHLVICNGEGEKIFRNYLGELMRPDPDYARVKGLSFYKDNSLITTPDEEPLRSLDEVPSPFASRFFDEHNYDIAYLETSRGCPFACEYCYENSPQLKGKPVIKLSRERIESDILRLAEKRVENIKIVDENFGLFPQDLDTAKLIAQCKQKYGFPTRVHGSTTKRNTDRMAKIVKIFHDAGIICPCEIPFQTLDITAMKKINRKLDLNSYASLWNFLNNEGISSYVELIWPLPGETLGSFKQGIAKLCEMNANAIAVYPFFFMNNIGMQNRKIEYGIETVHTENVNSEDELVVRTNEVSPEDAAEGWRFAFAATALYCVRSLFTTARYLDNANIEKYGDLFDNFVRFVTSDPDISDFSCFEDVKKGKILDPEMCSAITYDICHAERNRFDDILLKFASSHRWWEDETARLFFEVDLLNRGYVYSEAVMPKTYTFNYLNVSDTTAGGYVADIPSSFAGQIRDMLGVKASFSSERVEINHKQEQIPFDEKTSLMERQWYSYKDDYDELLFFAGMARLQ